MVQVQDNYLYSVIIYDNVYVMVEIIYLKNLEVRKDDVNVVHNPYYGATNFFDFHFSITLKDELKDFYHLYNLKDEVSYQVYCNMNKHT